jgi:hypothetical protein
MRRIPVLLVLPLVFSACAAPPARAPAAAPERRAAGEAIPQVVLMIDVLAVQPAAAGPRLRALARGESSDVRGDAAALREAVERGEAQILAGPKLQLNSGEPAALQIGSLSIWALADAAAPEPTVQFEVVRAEDSGGFLVPRQTRPLDGEGLYVAEAIPFGREAERGLRHMVLVHAFVIPVDAPAASAP